MSHQQFMASDENRARYWARSFAGWHKFSGVQPNAAHESIARLQHSGAGADRAHVCGACTVLAFGTSALV